MLTIVMTGAKKISLSPVQTERMKKVFNLHRPYMTADNIKRIRCLSTSTTTPLSPNRGPPP